MKELMKNPMNRRKVVGGLVATALGALGLDSHGQTGAFPSRPIKIIVPWAAGGGGDVLVRAIAPSMSQRLGQPVVIDNRPGAIGTIGSLAAARSPADGYTLVYGAADSHSIANRRPIAPPPRSGGSELSPDLSTRRRKVATPKSSSLG